MQRTTNIAFAIANFCRQNRRMAFEDNEDTVLVLDEIQESVVTKNSISQKLCRWKMKVGFLREDNLRSVIFQKRIFGMGKYNKVVVL